MTDPVELLLDQLKDARKRNSTRVELIRRGGLVTVLIISRLREESEPSYRKTLMRILLELKDRRAEELFRELIRSEDEEIRAISPGDFMS